MSGGSNVLVTLHRELLRLGRRLDRRPLSKALLIAQPGVFFDRRSRELVRLPHLDGPQGEWAQMLASFNRGEFYAPASSACCCPGTDWNRTVPHAPLQKLFG